MKKILILLNHMILWGLFIIILLFAIICFSESLISVILLVIAALLCCPLFLRYIKLKKRITIPIAIVLFCGALLLIPTTENNSDQAATKNTTNTSDNSTTPKSTGSAENTTDDVSPNTSAMVDSIARKAKKSANQSASSEKRDDAITFIAEQYPNYFVDNETMEKTMYYGFYLEYAYSKNGSTNTYANLGMDTYQAVKGVYRNVDKISDDIVQENLRQIKESLSELGYKVS